MVTYKDKLTEVMDGLAEDKRVVFIGQGLMEQEPFYGTLSRINKKRMLEMPCAEILSTGVAIGLALTGWLPVLLFQRMDFMLLAADQLLNHAALFPAMSGGQIKVPMIIRACIGSQDPKFDVGIQHRKDFTHLFEGYIDLLRLSKETMFKSQDKLSDYLLTRDKPIMTIEWKDLYNEAI